ncbi:hypothetical protein [Micromonospora tarensis]|uniref:VOC domain-containing protein n=1 Tax=Micromonospora tarensis TaxID=2806100 RepID=A0ABS1YA70_9ACTN|nr:hypothetical protein [Micromonospora tarensis]MBM0274296.1 hypothetical protein [Micromonospora tarensis]
MEAELSRGLALAAELGFQLDFVDEVALPAAFEGIEGHAHRLPLAVLAAADGLRLEVVRHRRDTGRPSAYRAVFQAPPPADATVLAGSSAAADVLRLAGLLRTPTCVSLPAAGGGEAWFDASRSAGAGLGGLLCPVGDVPAEVDFWSAFAKATWRGVRADAAWGSIPSPRPQPRCELVLTRGADDTSPYSMNDLGFPSIGVYSTAIESDCERALAAGAKLRAAPIVTEINGRRLRMALIESPGGAPIELLCVHRDAVKEKLG